MFRITPKPKMATPALEKVCEMLTETLQRVMAENPGLVAPQAFFEVRRRLHQVADVDWHKVEIVLPDDPIILDQVSTPPLD